ncbi:MAG: S9 family peptidase [Candidatus Methanofastidiosia archaeon]|jgi:dipeptidyl aminopeptidase/acylaminoacyl peptidase
MNKNQYGSWKSPITSDIIVSETIDVGQISIDDAVYWIEMRPAEEGRYVIVKYDGEITDVNPPPFNARTRVHEYGGGQYIVDNGVVYFSNFDDQRLYKQTIGGNPEPLTPESNMRYADSVVHNNDLICVREDHTKKGEAVNSLVRIDGKTGESTVLISGNDFYSTPRVSPDGSYLAWLTWNHPNMPWDGTELWVGTLKNGSIVNAIKVAGGKQESIFQPEWSPDNVLYFVSDKTGWWNIYCWHNTNTGRKAKAKAKAKANTDTIEPVCPMEAEFGKPQWVFGRSTYDFVSDSTIVCTYGKNGIWHVGTLDVNKKTLHEIPTPYTAIGYLRAAKDTVIFRGGSPTEFESIVMLNLDTKECTVLRSSGSIKIDPGYISVPNPVEYPTTNGFTAHAFYYPPRNKDYTPPDENPPLLVKTHGGPTSAVSSTLNLKVQYWTSRGIAVLDVNYRGSTGYGREYRTQLNKKWGIVDVKDCVNGALHLVKTGEVDKNKLAINGGSAGGYTTLCALAFTDVFKAGASYYGVSDAEALTKETHKFESHYLDTLIGPYPEEKEVYRERSAVYHVDELSCPVIFFQGLEDKIVLPNQAETMVNALKKKGIPVAYIPFEKEQHGFRRSKNIKRALDAELYFYGKIFGFELADPVEDVPIENL